MKEYRITKYNPVNRDSEGAYLLEDWTDLSDVGKIWNGTQLTNIEYLAVEKAYIDVVFKMLAHSNLDHLRIVDWGNHYYKSFDEVANLWYYENDFKLVTIYEDKLVKLNELEVIIKLILRGFIWCRLEISKLFYVHFGYDFYMYIGGKEITETIQSEINKMGLFIESFGSPYYKINQKWFLQKTKAGDNIVIDQIEIPYLNVEQIKKHLNLSSDHPGDIGFDIVSENAEILKGKFKFDFEKFEYSIFCDNTL